MLLQQNYNDNIDNGILILSESLLLGESCLTSVDCADPGVLVCGTQSGECECAVGYTALEGKCFESMPKYMNYVKMKNNLMKNSHLFNG